MARIRTIKPDFWKDEDLSKLPPETHMLAAALLNYADDEGYFKANPKLVEADCCPLREDSTKVRRSIELLAKAGYIRLFTGTDGKDYGLVVNFIKHQRVDRPKESAIKPLETLDEPSTTNRRAIDDETAEEGNGMEGKGKGSAEQDSTPAILFPLNDKSEHPITENQITEWSELYPAVDVMQELRKMRGWLLANPTKRKTKKGIAKFVNGWLASEQDKGRSGKAATQPSSPAFRDFPA